MHRLVMGLALGSVLLTACADEADVERTVAESHSWGSFHWARSGPFDLLIGDNLTTVWDPYLAASDSDWSSSSVLDLVQTAGLVTNVKRCRATAGRVEVCNSKYGKNGWLGMAQIWASGSHITQAIVKVNDSYFTTAKYNTPAWRNLVMCQEVGHVLGLDHQDEAFANPPLGTCMDYSNDPVPNQHPNAHDYEQLEIIYDHDDPSTTVGTMPAEMASGDLGAPGTWGELVSSSRGGRAQTFVRDFGDGRRVVTHVLWVD